jgi:hypothetical protein
MVALLCSGCSSSHGNAGAAAQRAQACVEFSAAIRNRDASARASLLNEAYAAAVASGDRGLAGGMDPAALSRARTPAQRASLVNATTDRCNAISWKPSISCTLRRRPCAGVHGESTVTPTTAG